MGSGTVGGKLLSSRSHGRRAAEIALRILNGEKPADIPVDTKANNPYMFDYNQLKRWHINMAALPENSIIINEPPSFYYLYKTRIWTAAAVIAVLSAMILILFANILRRRQAEKALAYAEKVYREAIGYAHGVPYQVRFSDDKYLFIGIGAEKLIGVPVEKLTRKVFCELVDDVILTDPDVSMDLDSYRKEFEKGMISRYQADLHLCTPSGQKKWLSDCSVPLRDEKTGEVFGAMGVLQDITQRKRAEKALQDSEVLYRSLVDALPQNIYRVDRKGVLIFANKAYLSGMGMTLEECLGKTAYDLSPKELADKYLADDKRLMETGEILDTIESHEQLSTGKMLSVRVVKTATRDADGNITGVQGIFWDITERKIAEKKLLDYQNQLKSLASKLSLAEERERRRIAMELHDRISQSLIISKIELEGLRSSASSESFSKALGKVCDSLGQTIEDTSSLTFDLSSPVLYELGFEAAVKEWLVEQVEEKYGISTEFKKDNQLKFLEEDIGILLFRTVRELLINVVKHAQANKVKVSTYKQDSQACVIVEDDGVGFDPAEISHVPDRAGSFGLFSIRERLAHLGGRLEIKAASNQGTKVTVKVPLKRTIADKLKKI